MKVAIIRSTRPLTVKYQVLRSDRFTKEPNKLINSSLILLFVALLFSGSAQAETWNPFASLFGKPPQNTATQADPKALNEALRAKEAGDYAKAATLLLPLAEKGDPVAQFNLGALYTQGQIIQKDYRIAMQWYLAAAQQGHAEAQARVGGLYADGTNVPQDFKKAMQWLMLSAKQGNATAQLDIGEMYATGKGVPQNYKEAIKWYQLSADQGNATAYAKLADCYENGLGVTQDSIAALKWMNTAVNNASDENSRNAYLARRDTIKKAIESHQLALEQQREKEAAERARAAEAARAEAARIKAEEAAAVLAAEQAKEKAEADARAQSQRLADAEAKAEKAKSSHKNTSERRQSRLEATEARRRAEINAEVARHRAERKAMNSTKAPKPSVKAAPEKAQPPSIGVKNQEKAPEQVKTTIPRIIIDIRPKIKRPERIPPPAEKSSANDRPTRLPNAADVPRKPKEAELPHRPIAQTGQTEGKIHYPAKSILTDEELGNTSTPEIHAKNESVPVKQIEWSKKPDAP